MIKASIHVAFTPVLGALQAVKRLGKTEFNEPSLTNTFWFWVRVLGWIMTIMIMMMLNDDDDDA